MKTTTVARGFLGAVASLLGVVAVGCSAGGADEASAGNGEIGSVEQAITVAGLSGHTMTARQALASCVIVDRGTPKILAIGGFDSINVPKNDIFVYDLASNFTAALDSSNNPVTLATARGHMRAIQDPNDASSCIVVGGAATLNGNAIATTSTVVEKITVDSNGDFSVSSALDQLDVANYELRSCGDVILAFGGKKSGSGVISNVVNYLDTSSGSNTWQTITMGANRFDLGVRQDDLASAGDGRVFVISGGSTGSGRDATVDLLKATNTACTQWSIATNAVSGLSTGREGNVVVKDLDSPNAPDLTYLVAAGKIGAAPGQAADGSAEQFDVDWSSTPPTATAAAAANSLTSGAQMYLPTYVQKNPLTQDFVIGGLDDNSASVVTNMVQATKASQVNAPWDDSPGTLSTIAPNLRQGRFLATAEVITGSPHRIFVFGGKDTTTGLLTSVEVINP